MRGRVAKYVRTDGRAMRPQPTGLQWDAGTWFFLCLFGCEWVRAGSGAASPLLVPTTSASAIDCCNVFADCVPDSIRFLLLVVHYLVVCHS